MLHFVHIFSSFRKCIALLLHILEQKRQGSFLKLIEWINLYCFGTMFPLFLGSAGLAALFSLGGIFFANPRHTAACLFRNKSADKDYSPMRAMCLALAGTLGVGNIVGVAVALRLGGSGAVFWMWVSAFATMPLKFCEIVLSIDCQRKRKGKEGAPVLYGGPMYYIRKKWGTAAGGAFCVLCICASFCGNLVQMRAVSEAARDVFSLPRRAVGVAIFLGICVLIFGGRNRISGFTARVIPLCTAFYVLLCCAALLCMRGALREAFCSIFRGIFTLKSAAGGIGGFLCLGAMRHGIAKGVYSHEAGCGTAPISYAGTKRTELLRSGFLGIAEVFVDTVLLCTLTALVLLCAFPQGQGSDSSLFTVCNAFSGALGAWASYAVAAMVILFAFSTVVCWSFYGMECLRYFCGRRILLQGYCFLFCALGGLAVFWDTGNVWELSDFCTVLMALLNTGCLLTYLPVIRGITKTALFTAAGNPRAKNTRRHGASPAASFQPRSHSAPKNGSARQG